MSVVLSPYKIKCQRLPGGGPTYIDPNKTRLVAVFSTDRHPGVAPPNSKLIQEKDGSDITIRWYECLTELGRVYTVIPTACSVVISNFENGLLSIDGISAAEFGSSSFCFGQVYINGVHKANTENLVHFEFDDHVFRVEGVLAPDSEIFDCSGCVEEQTSILGELTTSIPDVTSLPDEAPTTITENQEPKISWNNLTTEENINVFCNEEEQGSIKTDICESQNNPSIVTLPSGKALAAYETRDANGLSSISLSVFDTSVDGNILYYRELSYGRLLNNTNIASGTGEFEVYDDIYIPTNESGVPLATTKIGFLTGPLEGLLFTISVITRTIEQNRVKHLISFNLGSRKAKFADGNHVSNVNWFLLQD